jgi:hypothetical protein
VSILLWMSKSFQGDIFLVFSPFFLFYFAILPLVVTTFFLVSWLPVATVKTHGRHSLGNLKLCFTWVYPSTLSALFCADNSLFWSTGPPTTL